MPRTPSPPDKHNYPSNPLWKKILDPRMSEIEVNIEGEGLQRT